MSALSQAADSCPEELLRLFQAMTEASRAVAWRADADGYVRAIAPREITGEVQAWLGRGWLELVHPDDVARVRAALQEASARRFLEISYRALAGDEYRWFRVRGARISGQADEGDHWLGLISEMDAEAREREALARTEQAYRTLVEATASLVWRWRQGGGSIDGRGWAFPNTYDGDEWLEAVHPEDREQAAAAWDEARAKGSPSLLEFRARTDQGVYRWCLSRAAPVRDRDGAITEWVGSVTDIHEEKLARDALLRRDTLEAVGRLTAGVAHDFNNLLTVITAGAEALAEALPEGDPLRGEAELTLHAAERGAELVRSLLAISRQQTLAPQSIDIGGALETLARLVRRALGADLHVEVAHGAPGLFCFADPAQLASALLNLCINARDALPAGGRLWLESTAVDLDGAEAARLGVAPGPYVMLSVRDNGTGMSPDVLEHALEPFFTTKAVGQGSGLGLSMAHGFVRQSGGHLAILSAAGEGTAIQLYLPRTDKAEEESAPSPCARPRAAAAHILLVEDDHMVRDQVARQLRALGYRVTPVADGRAAVAVLAQDHSVALLMTDIVMPGGMNGRQLADHARLLRPDLAVLFTSGYTDDAIVREGRISPGDAFLPKPYRRARLAEAVAGVLCVQG
jgi:signal transduction histidine kinase/CheY-like chemotaxis protein